LCKGAKTFLISPAHPVFPVIEYGAFINLDAFSEASIQVIEEIVSGK
jgi:hypothetical protein